MIKKYMLKEIKLLFQKVDVHFKVIHIHQKFNLYYFHILLFKLKKMKMEVQRKISLMKKRAKI